jgi:uncharacterized protein YndB with AHSA1/START domain
MAVDVLTETVIARPPSEVAAFASNPDNAPKWYVNIKRAQWETSPPLGVGSRITFTAHFLGREFVYTYEIVDFIPGRRLVMRTAQGPFPMETTYTWEPAPDGGARMTLRNRGEPSGFSRVVAPLMAKMMRKENRKDLARLKQILERGGGF